MAVSCSLAHESMAASEALRCCTQGATEKSVTFAERASKALPLFMYNVNAEHW